MAGGLTPLPSLIEMLRLDPSLTGLGAQLTEEERVMQGILAQLKERAAAAGAEAGAARTRFEKAQAAPEPSGGAGDIITRLGGDVASAVSGNPRFAARAETTVANERADRLRKRGESLATLRDEYLRRAEIAMKADQLDVATKLQAQAAKVDNLHEQLQKRQQNVFSAEQNRLDREARATEGRLDRAAQLERARIEADQRLSTAKNAAQRGLLTRNQLITTERMLFNAINKKDAKGNRIVNVEDAKNQLLQIKELHSGRLQHEVTPELMVKRLEAFNTRIDQMGLPKAGGFLGMGAKEIAGPTFTDDEIEALLARYFSEEEINAYYERVTKRGK